MMTIKSAFDKCFKATPVSEKIGDPTHTHFATLENGWQALCRVPLPAEGGYVHGTLVQESEISCPICRKQWRAGMQRVQKLFADYQGEE